MKMWVLAGLLIGGTALAQREVAPTDFVQPSAADIVIGGNEMAKDVRCDNNSVYVEGQHNEVQVHGNCKFVRVQGDRNYVWIERVTTANVEGNENMIFVSNPETRYSSRGNGNRFEKAKH
jgi:hypothetical protein